MFTNMKENEQHFSVCFICLFCSACSCLPGLPVCLSVACLAVVCLLACLSLCCSPLGCLLVCLLSGSTCWSVSVHQSAVQGLPLGHRLPPGVRAGFSAGPGLTAAGWATVCLGCPPGLSLSVWATVCLLSAGPMGWARLSAWVAGPGLTGLPGLGFKAWVNYNCCLLN